MGTCSLYILDFMVDETTKIIFYSAQAMLIIYFGIETCFKFPEIKKGKKVLWERINQLWNADISCPDAVSPGDTSLIFMNALIP